MRISDWSSDVCSSDLSATLAVADREADVADGQGGGVIQRTARQQRRVADQDVVHREDTRYADLVDGHAGGSEEVPGIRHEDIVAFGIDDLQPASGAVVDHRRLDSGGAESGRTVDGRRDVLERVGGGVSRSEEHTSELQ